MARHRLSKVVDLKAYPPERPYPAASDITLNSQVTTKQDARDSTRRRFGRSISMDVIENALRSAQRGSMRDITDLSRETIDTDPHLGSVLVKRFSALMGLPYDVIPATGTGINKERANHYAQVVREQLENMRGFKKSLYQLAWGLFDGRVVLENKWINLRKGTDNPKYGRTSRALNSITWVHPRRLNFGPSRELRIVSEEQTVSGNFPPIGLSLDEDTLKQNGYWRKFIQWTPQLFGEYPEREGLGPRCMYWSFFKRFSQRDRMMLLELFGKPWRITEVDEDSTASGDDLLASDRIIDGLGAAYSARMPRGTKLNVVSPGTTAGAVHKDVIEESDRQISKLVLGQTGTTDGVPAGLNSNQANVMADEQFMLLQRDSQQISEVVEDQVSDGIIEVNFGASALPHAPRFLLRADGPADRVSEGDRLNKALLNGLRIGVNEAYEISGFKIPEQEDAVLAIEQPPIPPLAPVAPAPRPVIVYPKNTSPSSGEQQPPPSTGSSEEGASEGPIGNVGAPDTGKFVTVNEARAGQGLPPLTLPDGTPDPDGNLTIEEYEAKKGGAPLPVAATRTQLDAENVEELGILLEMSKNHLAQPPVHVCCATDEPLPRSTFGSPDDIVDDLTPQLAEQTAKWAEKFEKAVDGEDDPVKIHKKLNRVFEKLDLDPYTDIMAEGQVQVAALGALDDALEAELIDAKGNVIAAKGKDFSQLRFLDAFKWFVGLEIVTKEDFKRLEDELKRQSFTVAGIQSRQMLAAIQMELAQQIAEGADLRKFSARIAERLEKAGMVPSVNPDTGLKSAGHVKTTFRTNTMSAYNTGRYEHQTQPSVLAARPVWEFRAVNEPGRTRATHLAASGKMLLATDPFWQTAYPPYGFNCRCRVITRPKSFLSKVVAGSTISGLPDPGFVSGISAV